MDFKIGDTVVALMDFGEPPVYGLIKGREYKIQNMYTCRCGSTLVDVGVKLYNSNGTTYCNTCGTDASGSGKWWFMSYRFTKNGGNDSSVDVSDFMELFTKKVEQV